MAANVTTELFWNVMYRYVPMLRSSQLHPYSKVII